LIEKDRFVDLILFDGLYADKKTINLAVEQGSDVLIKTDEESLSIIKDAKGLFENWREIKGVFYTKKLT